MVLVDQIGRALATTTSSTGSRCLGMIGPRKKENDRKYLQALGDQDGDKCMDLDDIYRRQHHAT